MADIYMRILLSASGNSSVISAVQSVTSALGSGGLAGTLLAVGTAAAATAVGIGVTAVKAAGDFQAGLTSLVTGAGEVQSNLGMVSDGILKLAVDTGTSTKSLTDGMYMIESSGQHGSQALDTLGAAARGARVGAASLADVANGVTTEMTDYASSHLTAAQATNTLIATVAAGKTHMGELATAMSTILPTASALKISLGDTSGAMATMTGEGTNAASAATYLRQLLSALENPAKKGATALKAIGLSASDVSDSMKKSLPDTLQLITDHLKNKFPEGSAAYVAALAAISGGSKQMQGMLELTGQHLDVFKGNVAGIASAVNNGGNAITGWSLVQQNFNFKMSQASEVVETLMIRIGQALLPVVTSLADKIIPVVTQFSNWITSGNRLQSGLSMVGSTVQRVGSFLASNLLPPLAQLGVVLAPATVAFSNVMIKGGGFKDIATGIVAVMAGIVIGTGKLIGGLASIIGFFEKNQVAAVSLLIPLGALGGYFVFLGVSAVAAFLAAAPAMIAGFIAGAAAAWTMAAGVIAATWPFLLIGAAIGLVIAIIILLVTHWSQVVSFLSISWKVFSFEFMATLGAIGAFFTKIWSGIASWWKGVWSSATTDAKATTFLFSSWWSGVWTGIMNGLKAAWDFIVMAVKIGVAALIAVIFAPIIAIATLFIWLYNHNYYFKALCDAIVHYFQIAIAWLVSAWNAAIAWLSTAWKNIVAVATVIWSAISTTIQRIINNDIAVLRSAWQIAIAWLTAAWNTISGTAKVAWFLISDTVSSALHSAWSAIVSVWSMAISWLSSQWNTLSGMAKTAWSAVSTVFSGIWVNYIQTPLTNFWSSLTTWFGGLAGQAAQIGANIINSIVSGITNAAGAVGSEVQSVVNGALSAAGFHGLPGMPGHAAGILNSPVGHWAVVGEKGPEMMYVPQGASIFANGTSFAGGNTGKSGGNTGSGTTIVFAPNMTLQGLDESSLEHAGQWFMTYLGDQIRSQYGNV